MATASTPLLADFDHNVTFPAPFSADASHASIHTSTPPSRPPTPDPRQPLRPPPLRKTREASCPLSYHTHEQHQLRRKPTAIFVGGEHNTHRDASAWPTSPHIPASSAHLRSQPPTLSSLLPLPPSTPSPRLPAVSPSLSSSGTTVQSSPTLTPTTAFGSYFIEDSSSPVQRSVTGLGQPSKLGLRRAKRLPHKVNDLWEVHAVVSVGGDRQRQQQQWSGVQPESVDYSSQPTSQPSSEQKAAEPAYFQENATFPRHQREVQGARHSSRRQGRGVKFWGVSSESASREGSLRRSQEEDTSSYSLSKYQFPPPPAFRTAGPFGYAPKPTTLHYRGASFDLVNPHASLLLGAADFETPAEVDCLLDDYFERTSTMARKLYDDTNAARRHILGPDRIGQGAPTTPQSPYVERSVSPMTPEQEGFVRRQHERFAPSPVQPERPLFSPRPLQIRSANTDSPAAPPVSPGPSIRYSPSPGSDNQDTTPPTPVDPYRPDSNPFDLSVNENETSSALSLYPGTPAPDAGNPIEDLEDQDGPQQGERLHGEEGTTISRLLNDYEYPRPPPTVDEDTLMKLDPPQPLPNAPQPLPRSPSECSFPESLRILEQEANTELPTTDRTYGDTNELLNLHSTVAPLDYTAQATAPPTAFSLECRLCQVHTGSATHTRQSQDPGSHDASVHSGQSNTAVQPDFRGDSKMGTSPPSIERHRGGVSRGRDIERTYSSRHRFPTHQNAESSLEVVEDGISDWVTERDTSEIRNSLIDAANRQSQASYANTSFYGDENRLSALSTTMLQPSMPAMAAQLPRSNHFQNSLMPTTQGANRPSGYSDVGYGGAMPYHHPLPRPGAAMGNPPAMLPRSQTSQTLGAEERRSERNLLKIMHDAKTPNLPSQAQPPLQREVEANDNRSRFAWFRWSRSDEPAKTPREIEDLNKKDPFNANNPIKRAASILRLSGGAMMGGLDRIRGMFSQERGAEAARRQNAAIMASTLPSDNDREQLVMAASTGNASQHSNATASNPSIADSIQPQQAGLAPFNQMNSTLRHIRSSGSIIAGRAAMDLGEGPYRLERPWTPTEPQAALFTTRDATMPFSPLSPRLMAEGISNQNRARRAQHGRFIEEIELDDMPSGRAGDRGKGRAGRSAMSSQRDLHPMQLSGSPTSNINFPYTETEDFPRAMARFPTNMTSYSRVNMPRPQVRDTNWPNARITAAVSSLPGDEGRMLIGENEPRSMRTRAMQHGISNRYYLRSIWNPYMLLKYSNGGYDHKIAAETGGEIRGMAWQYKKEAATAALLITLLYMLLVVVGLAFGLSVGRTHGH